MTQTLDNGITVPINSDAYQLTADLATLGNSANVATICTNQAARDALTKYTGRLAMRVDTGGLDVYNGSAWVPVKPSGAINGGLPTDLTGVQGTWARAYTSGNRRPRVWSTDGITAHVTGLMVYNGSSGSIVTIPTAYAPADSTTIMYVGSAVASNGASNPVGGASLTLGITGGILQVIYQTASLTTGSYVPINGSWLING